MKKLFLLCFIAFLAKHLQANNIKIENVLVNNGVATFSLSWDNSWNATNNIDTLYPNNWDAVWIFVKVQSDATNLWSHLNLTTSGHTVTGGGADLTLETQPDNVGVFIRRTNAGHGNIASAQVTLQLGSFPVGNSFNVKLFGIEMVHIPAGPFYIGDGNASTAGNLYYTNQVLNSTTQSNGISAEALHTGSLATPNTYPMGVNAFYSMKYEITNQQAADFLNTLTYDQQALHFKLAQPNAARKTRIFGVTNATYSTVNRYICIDTPGVNNTQPAVVGVNYDNDDIFNEGHDGLSNANVNFDYNTSLAYLDWCGLRPMTELEFEKMCRGSRINGNPVAALLNEYPWGSTAIATQAGSTLAARDSTTERSISTPVNGRVVYDVAVGTSRPYRVGIFAQNATGRAAAGAGFYGNMNLADNGTELVVNTYAGGLGFTGINGDGVLDINAKANQSGWTQLIDAQGLGYRGGFYHLGVSLLSNYAKTSYRSNANATLTANPDYLTVRGVR
jgi:formylglycine-generating enzyme required for sulfatase activity